MFHEHAGHAWHMVLMVGIVVVLAGRWGRRCVVVGALACVAMMGAFVWIAWRATRPAAAEPTPRPARADHHGEPLPGR
jgi:hypothetical protein